MKALDQCAKCHHTRAVHTNAFAAPFDKGTKDGCCYCGPSFCPSFVQYTRRFVQTDVATCNALLLAMKVIGAQLEGIESEMESLSFDADHRSCYVVQMRVPTKHWPERNRFEELASQEVEAWNALDVLGLLLTDHYVTPY